MVSRVVTFRIHQNDFYGEKSAAGAGKSHSFDSAQYLFQKWR